jgi:hypothetical protein
LSEQARRRERVEPGARSRGPAGDPQVCFEHDHPRRRIGLSAASCGRGGEVATKRGAQIGADAREQIQFLVVERPIASITVGLDPSPAAEPIPTGDRRDITDADRPHDLVPACGASEISCCLGIQADR